MTTPTDHLPFACVQFSMLSRSGVVKCNLASTGADTDARMRELVDSLHAGILSSEKLQPAPARVAAFADLVVSTEARSVEMGLKVLKAKKAQPGGWQMHAWLFADPSAPVKHLVLE
jgi:hypothetical protein